jgi:hypothetical protein
LAAFDGTASGVATTLLSGTVATSFRPGWFFPVSAGAKAVFGRGLVCPGLGMGATTIGLGWGKGAGCWAMAATPVAENAETQSPPHSRLATRNPRAGKYQGRNIVSSGLRRPAAIQGASIEDPAIF